LLLRAFGGCAVKRRGHFPRLRRCQFLVGVGRGGPPGGGSSSHPASKAAMAAAQASVRNFMLMASLARGCQLLARILALKPANRFIPAPFCHFLRIRTMFLPRAGLCRAFALKELLMRGVLPLALPFVMQGPRFQCVLESGITVSTGAA